MEPKANQVDDDLESGKDLCDDAGSDATLACVGENDVAVITEVIVKTTTKFAKAACAFVRRLTPTIVAHHIDWAIICEHREDINSYRPSCKFYCVFAFDEMVNNNFNTTNPTSETCENISIKMKALYGKDVTKQQCYNY
uniref:Uncharacterized protein n=1 Tax=Oryza brachyantha TaxID=4533 RepID=J3MVT3_ORYBR